MPPPRSLTDAKGYYSLLGLTPSATRADIVAAFRNKARVLHPDVPGTGDVGAFVALKQAYDVLSNGLERAAYDRSMQPSHEPPPPPRTAQRPRRPPGSRLRTWTVTIPLPFMLPVTVSVPRPSLDWIGNDFNHFRPTVLFTGIFVAGLAFIGLGSYKVYHQMTAPPRVQTSGIRPNAQTVEPLSPKAQRALETGPLPLKLAGTPNFYVQPSGSPAILWRLDPAQHRLLPLGQLPPFSAVQAIRLNRQNGMLEVLVNNAGNGFISADHLTPGNLIAARQAYCSYNAGPPPFDGELLDQRGTGDANLVIQNKGMQPAVVKLRDRAGETAVALFLGPMSRSEVHNLPAGEYTTDFAVGELWSRACNIFAAGMRARRMSAPVRAGQDETVAVTPEGADSVEISEQAFAHK